MAPIELFYMLPLILVMVGFLAAWLSDKVRWWIVAMAIPLAMAITYVSSPYYIYAIVPIRNHLLYGTTFDLLTGMAYWHVISVSAMSIVAFKNLYVTGGFTIWTMVMPAGTRMEGFRQLRREMKQMRRDGSGIAPLILLGGIAAATLLGGWGIYNFFQNPDVTYNIDSPIGGTSSWLPFSAGGVGINTDLIIIVSAVLIFLYFMFRSQD